MPRREAAPRLNLPPWASIIPRKLSQLGALVACKTGERSGELSDSDFTGVKAVRGFISYEVNSPYWLPEAQVSRWLWVPDRSSITFTETGEWEFPTGAVLLKHVELPFQKDRPDRRRPIETQLIVFGKAGRNLGASYRWREDGTDADLVEDNDFTQIPRGLDADNPKRTWFFPGVDTALNLKTTVFGYVVEASTAQLNRDCTYPGGITDNQLRA